MDTNSKTGVGIAIPTMNRSEFVIRQLNYYAQVGCHHTIYIVDSSPTDEFNKPPLISKTWEIKLMSHINTSPRTGTLGISIFSS